MRSSKAGVDPKSAAVSNRGREFFATPVLLLEGLACPSRDLAAARLIVFGMPCLPFPRCSKSLKEADPPPVWRDLIREERPRRERKPLIKNEICRPPLKLVESVGKVVAIREVAHRSSQHHCRHRLASTDTKSRPQNWHIAKKYFGSGLRLLAIPQNTAPTQS